MKRIWIPAAVVIGCAMVGLELDHTAMARRADASTAAAADAGSTCFWRSATDVRADPWLSGTIRDARGRTETLHLMWCTDGWSGWRWMSDPRLTVPASSSPSGGHASG